MIYILSWTTKKHQNTLSRPLHSELKKIQGLFQEKWNSRTFQGLPLKFKDFSRLCEQAAKHLSFKQLIVNTLTPSQCEC